MPEDYNPYQSNQQKLKHILFFGNSLTAGYGLPANQSFPALLQQKINSQQLSYHIVNAGLSGETSVGGKNRIAGLLNQPIDVFVLELGINDILRGITVAETKNNLQFIIDTVKNKQPNIKMILLGMELPPFLTGNILIEFRMIFRQLADKNQMAFLPFLLHGVAGNRLLNLADGVHPNAKGYEIIAENVWQVLKTIL
ncbi:arylesterase [Mucilaginibacter arboris]|uniref:Arylesterase n=1 Tax=Mucilaginibacter arboris TaxID=2682090 RepID=A0A7K1SY76_9SPHI|nr:arylesterase [Mucilaginibacter arboris]MVN22275.1 arylesterase [Mucilaginibacter arboris]